MGICTNIMQFTLDRSIGSVVMIVQGPGLAGCCAQTETAGIKLSLYNSKMKF